jgi:Na+/H+ antiporter NhaD/arsenite permease-like protein
MDIAFIIFLLTYVVIALGQPPLFRIDRTGAAIIGASCMLIFKVLSVYDAYEAIDYKTIIILFGMMILIANLRLSGFFKIVLNFLVKKVQNPTLLLYIIVFASGLLSAFFINDTVPRQSEREFTQKVDGVSLSLLGLPVGEKVIIFYRVNFAY